MIFEDIEDEDEEKKKKRFDKAVKVATMKREREKREEIAKRNLEQLDADLAVKKRLDMTTKNLLARVSLLKSSSLEWKGDASSRLHRVDTLTKKIASVLATSTMETSEDLKSAQARWVDLDRSRPASRAEPPLCALTKLNKAIKKKALNDLMKTLPELGITHKRAAVQKFREPQRVMVYRTAFRTALSWPKRKVSCGRRRRIRFCRSVVLRCNVSRATVTKLDE